MKVAIPTKGDGGLDSVVGEHFGRVPNYTIVDMGEKKICVVSNTSSHKGGKGYPPEIMKENDVDVMICRDIGSRAVSIFKEMGIKVFIGAKGTAKNALDDFKEGRLKSADTEHVCRGHMS